MTVLEALATLESAVLDCKKRNVNAPEVKAALDLLEPCNWPKWVVPQFRHHAQNDETKPLENREDNSRCCGQHSMASVTVFVNLSVCEWMRSPLDFIKRKI